MGKKVYFNINLSPFFGFSRCASPIRKNWQKDFGKDFVLE